MLCRWLDQAGIITFVVRAPVSLLQDPTNCLVCLGGVGRNSVQHPRDLMGLSF
jgi:hypothetical protein